MDTRGRHLTMNINMGLNKLLVSSTVWSYSDEDRLVVWSNMTDFFWRIMKHKWFYIVKKQHILLARCAVLCTMPKTKTCKTQKSFKWYIPYVYCGYFTTELLSSITLWLEPFQKFKFLFCFFRVTSLFMKNEKRWLSQTRFPYCSACRTPTSTVERQLLRSESAGLLCMLRWAHTAAAPCEGSSERKYHKHKAT